MTVGELIQELLCHEPELEVRVVTRPSDPLEHAVAGVVADAEVVAEDAGDRVREVVVVVAGDALGAGRPGAFSAPGLTVELAER